MGIWDTPLPEAEKNPLKPEGASTKPDTGTHILSGVIDQAKDSAKYIANSANTGFWNFVGNVAETYKAAGKEPLPASAARLFFGTELVDSLGISPYSTAQQALRDKAALEGKYKEDRSATSKVGIKDRFTEELPSPGPISSILGKGAEFVADPMNLVGGPASASMKAAPLLSQTVRPALTAFGAGAGAETGRMTGGPLAAMAGGEGARPFGEAAGSIVGAVAGGNAQDVRLNALKTVAEPVTNVGKAMSATAKAYMAGDERNLFRIFADNYGDLSKNAQGLLTEHVRSQYADAISRDPQAQQSLKAFDEAIAKSGGPSDAPWNLGQRATTPVLVEEIRLRVPASGLEAEKLAAADKGTQADVFSRFKSLFGRSKVADSKDVAASLEDLRKETNLKLDALASEGQQVADGVSHWDLPGTAKTADKGAELRALADAEVKLTAGMAREKYAGALNTANELGSTVMPDAILRQGRETMASTLSKIDPTTAPPELQRLMNLVNPAGHPNAKRIQQLQDMALTADGPTKLKLNTEISGLRKELLDADKAPLTLKDINDMNIALSREASKLAANGDLIAAANVHKMSNAIAEDVSSQLPEVVRTAYSDARKFYRDVHAPRAREGANLNIRRDAGSARAGEERVVDEQMFNQYLQPNELETRMKQFDNLFGGVLPNTVRNEKAYALMGEGLEDKYYREIISKSAIKPEADQAFRQKYNSALERLPGTSQKLDDTFNRLVALEGQKQLQADRFKDILGHPLTRAIGVDEAKSVMTDALKDPSKMQKLIEYTTANQGKDAVQPLVKYIMELANPMSGGQYDPRKLMVLTNAGKGDGRVSSLQTLFQRAYGTQVGNEHFDNLQAIATLVERQGMTSPEFLRPQGTANPDLLRDKTGTSGASYLSNANNAAQGRVSTLWVTALTGGRYLNMKLGEAMRKLQYEALFDPEASRAVVDMARTRIDRPLARGTAQAITDRMGKEGKSLLSRLVDTGAVRPISLQSGRIGVLNDTKEYDKENR